MALTLHDFTIERIPGVAKTATVFGHTTDPGRLYCTYPVGITGPAYVDVAGTRVWRNGLKHGQYLAREGASTAARESQTWLFKIRTADITYTPGAAAYVPNRQFLVQNNRLDTGRRVNWGIQICTQNRSVSGTVGHQIFIMIAFSQNSSSVDTYFGSNPYYEQSVSVGGYIRFAIVMTSGDSKVYVGSLTNMTSSALSFSGTMGGSEWLTQHASCQWAKYGSILSDTVLTDFLTNDTWAGSPVASYQGGYEIVESAPVFWDTSGNNLDLSAVDVQYWPAAAASGDYTDTGFTSPAFSIPITIASDAAAGPYTIGLRRNRVGIPSRTPPLSDAELYDDASVVVTVSDIALTGAVGPVVNARVKIL